MVPRFISYATSPNIVIVYDVSIVIVNDISLLLSMTYQFQRRSGKNWLHGSMGNKTKYRHLMDFRLLILIIKTRLLILTEADPAPTIWDCLSLALCNSSTSLRVVSNCFCSSAVLQKINKFIGSTHIFLATFWFDSIYNFCRKQGSSWVFRLIDWWVLQHVNPCGSLYAENGILGGLSMVP